MTTYTAIETRTNSHRLVYDHEGNPTGTVCNPTRLPKGELFVEGELIRVNESGYEVRRRVVCNKCNKVDPYGRR